MAARQNNGNIRQYRKPFNINLGTFIFFLIFVYIIICVGIYLFRDQKVVAYRVQEGALSVDNIYTAIALRDETVVTSSYNGYINYYAREGERVGANQLVCTVDESGQIKEILDEQNADNTSLSGSDMRELRTSISGFCANFSPHEFNSVYNFKYELEGTVLKLANINVLENLEVINNAASTQPVNLCYAPESGIITYSIDGYEDKAPSDLTDADFQKDNYEKTQLISNELTSASDPLYRLSTSENWRIVIQVDRTTAAQLENEQYVKVRFLKNQYESWGQVSIIDNGGEGNVLAVLELNNSMITFATDRFLDVEILSDSESGLKVPLSAITTQEFFLIPKDYITKGGSNGADCIFTATEQDMKGDIIWDSISQLDVSLENKSTWTGSFVQDESNAGNGGDGYANLTIDSSSTWIVDGDSTLSSLTCKGTITDEDGYTVTVKGSDGTTYVEGTSDYTITVSSYEA